MGKWAHSPLPKPGAVPLRPEKPPEEAPEVKPKVPTFADDRPHFRLKSPELGVPGEDGPPHQQHAPIEAPRLAGLPPAAPEIGLPVAGIEQQRPDVRRTALTGVPSGFRKF